jgi:hypothetical protein
LSPLTENRKAKRLKKGQKLSRTLSRKVAKYVANSFYVSIGYKFARKFSPKTRFARKKLSRGLSRTFSAKTRDKSPEWPYFGGVSERFGRSGTFAQLSRNISPCAKVGPLREALLLRASLETGAPTFLFAKGLFKNRPFFRRAFAWPIGFIHRAQAAPCGWPAYLPRLALLKQRRVVK